MEKCEVYLRKDDGSRVEIRGFIVPDYVNFKERYAINMMLDYCRLAPYSVDTKAKKDGLLRVDVYCLDGLYQVWGAKTEAEDEMYKDVRRVLRKEVNSLY